MEPISDEEKRQEAEIEALCRQISEKDPGYRNDDFVLTAMSELQDKLDRGEISPQEFFDAWDAEIGRKATVTSRHSRPPL